MKRIIVGITGASGSIYGIRAVEEFKKAGLEVFLVVSERAESIMKMEVGKSEIDKLKLFSDRIFKENELSAPIASGSFSVDGMVIVPCSIKTLSSVANSFTDNLITRAADVCLKERRKVVLCVRETPFNLTHLELMKRVTLNGGIVLPPIPAFYHNPKTIDDIINHTIGKIFDVLGIKHNLYKRWEGKP